VYLTLASNSPSIKTHACSNITATGFDAHVDDYDHGRRRAVVSSTINVELVPLRVPAAAPAASP
jgi:hypothetical protein